MKNIIVAPLNWGLGHATRCVPIINSLIKNNFTPIIASDGHSLVFLQKEFPDLETLELPSYNIFYGKNLKLSLLLQVPKIWNTVKKEQKLIANFIAKNNNVIGLISDNRFGVRSNKVTSIYITHQLNVLFGFATFLTSKIHQNIINTFDECWIPDSLNSEFSGKLSEGKKIKISHKYIGVLSRFKKEYISKNINVLVINSGVEPNRTSFERKLKKELLKSDKKIVLIQGKIETQQKIYEKKNIKIYNFMLSKELQSAINSSEIIICRSGYSSIMDLAVLQKKVFFIPTKNQTEQEYLASYLSEKNIAPFCIEDSFNFEKLLEIKNYSGLKSKETILDAKLFSLFHRKRKF